MKLLRINPKSAGRQEEEESSEGQWTARSGIKVFRKQNADLSAHPEGSEGGSFSHRAPASCNACFAHSAYPGPGTVEKGEVWHSVPSHPCPGAVQTWQGAAGSRLPQQSRCDTGNVVARVRHVRDSSAYPNARHSPPGNPEVSKGASHGNF
jgi:hypothetical protein